MTREGRLVKGFQSPCAGTWLSALDDEPGQPMPGERLCKLFVLGVGAGTLVWGLLLLLGVGR